MPRFAWWLSLVVGFLSLSQEIVWVRVVSFAFGKAPQAFSFVLASYLVGIAVGAVIGKRVCGSGRNLYRAAAVVLLAAGLADMAMPWLAATFIDGRKTDLLFEPFLLVAGSAALKSILFPIAHQLGSDASGPRLGRSVSRIYFANIIGSTLGPLVTGFWLLEVLTAQQCFVLSGWLCLGLASACALHRLRGVVPAFAVAASLAAWALVPMGVPSVLMEVADLNGGNVRHFIENRHGVVHTIAGKNGDTVFGGNIYDGITSVDTDRNDNMLERVYILALSHPAPRRVLVVGLSGGAWTRALLTFAGLEHVDAVEINPAYLQVIADSPAIAPVLSDPRVRIHVDDGRRWLKRHPGERYDLIVQNTTYYWRAGSTNILSREYMEEVRRHLAPGGIATFNTTGSYDVIATAQASFPHAARYSNFVYASDRPLVADPRRISELRRPDGQAFDLEAAVRDAAMPRAGSVGGRLLSARYQASADVLARATGGYGVITDDNMLPEYRHGRHFGPLRWMEYLPPKPATFR